MTKNKVYTETLIPVFCTSAGQAFETMAFTPLTCGAVGQKQSGFPLASISGAIGFTGTITATNDPLRGNVSLIFKTTVIEAIFRSMMGMDPADPVNPNELKDAVGELANMVAGGAKSALQGNGVEFNIGLPTVIVGEGHHIEAPDNASTFLIPVQCQHGEFYMELSFS